MRKRYAILGLSVFLALSLAVPAFGGPSNPVSSAAVSAKVSAKKALKVARSAKKKAKAAQASADAAQGTANQAETDAQKAETDAQKGISDAAAAQTSANTAETDAQTGITNAAAANANANGRLKSADLVIGTATALNTDNSKTASAACPSNEPILGGGYFVNGTTPRTDEVTVTTNDAVILYGHGWQATGEEINGNPSWSILAEVTCGTR